MNISWLKLDINILDNSKIKIIRSYPDGNSMVILWLGILCLAMKSQRPGIIEIADGIPYESEDFSKLFDIEKKTVDLALVLFQKYQMISMINGNCIEVINFLKFQSIEAIERSRELTRLRVEKYRNKLLAAENPTKSPPCNALLTRDCVTVTLTDKNKIRKEKDNNYSVEKNSVKENQNTEFEAFWKNYPRKDGKAQALKAWNKAGKSLPEISFILQKIDEMLSQYRIKHPSGTQFIPMASTWINNKRWEDEYDDDDDRNNPLLSKY